MEMQLPTSPSNRAIRNFMVDLELWLAPPTTTQTTLSTERNPLPPPTPNSVRPVILNYHSPLPSSLSTLLQAPLLLLSIAEEQEFIAIPLLSHVSFPTHTLTHAPVAKFVSLRILLTKIALNDWKGLQGDIVTTFLHGELEDEIYMKPPAGIHRQSGEEYLSKNGRRRLFDKNGIPQHLVWKLRKSIYGLRQSPRCFYAKLVNVLTSKGYWRIRTDHGVWRKLDIILIVHVDDMLLLACDEMFDDLPKSKLNYRTYYMTFARIGQ